MNYFISENVFAYNSGTEHAQARRVKLFAQLPGEPALYVTRDYNRFLDRDRRTLGLGQNQVLNMYDYFQGTTKTPRREQKLRALSQIPLAAYKIDGHGPNYSTLAENGRVLARIDVMPGTVGLVGTITYRDRFGNLTARENYDWRGFKSSVDYFHPDGQLARTTYLDQAGLPVLEEVFMNRNGQVAPTMWKLLAFHGHNYRFTTEDELFTFFLTQLVKSDAHARLFCERRSLDGAVGAVQAPQKWAVFHDAHEVAGRLLPAYRTVLVEHPAQFTGVLVGTKAQQSALTQEFTHVRAAVVPDTVISLASAPEALARIKHRVVMVGRLAPEKGPDAALRIFARVHAAVPDATLELRGYALSPAYQTQLETQADKLGVRASVLFAPYTTGLALQQSYQQAQVLLAPSQHEGFGMQLVEALECGTPVLAYDVEYGPREVIEPGVNGDLVQAGSESAAASKLIKMLTEAPLWHALHQGALMSAKRFGPEAAGKQWQAFLAANPVQ
ncbi:glycosyltransferase [Lacticaseibacillus camelliae]|uniref:Glycosyltransferase n=1 Tax=Lacticaseibacillus camelliae DSM 22697 = JCM 13995 TaxID=1423730 RepID=A0A0R2EXD5_9LACO|nr:glycosyltransferase [Lacticaseibacillus camelliae]KRN21072.1 glycosyltransferase [Lacticaseibacillus camelliae DSM 22697 = JCM 13995]